MNIHNPFESNTSRWADALSRSWSRVPATAGVVVSTALLAGLTYAVWRAVRNTHQTRQSARPAAPPDDVTRWEGEGGGMPVSGSRMAADTSPTSAGLGSSSAGTAGSGSSSTTSASRMAGPSSSLPH